MSRAPDAGPVTVLYVMDTLGLSGRTQGIIDLALRLDARRYRPVFCSLGEESSALADRLRACQIPIEVTPIRPGLRPGAVGTLMSVIRKHGVEVVHPVNPRPMLLAGAAARLLGIRAAIGSLSAFACQVPDRTYAFLPHQLVNRGARSALRNQLMCRLMRYVVVVAEPLGERFVRFTADAAGPLRLIGRTGLRRRMRVIGYGVDVERYGTVGAAAVEEMRALAGCGPDSVLVGSVGRLVEQKDYPTQLRAFAAAAHQEPRLRLVLAGDGPLRGALEALAADLGVADRTVFLGHWTRVPELLRALDVYVLASKFEPYGVALLEAKSAGCAIVSTSVNEIPSLVADGVSGLLVAPESADPMAAAFLRLARDADLRASLGRSAASDARIRHGLDAVAAAYQRLYDEALSPAR
jgi:glycosyltransferase involved in cell wall biosynthesis